MRHWQSIGIACTLLLPLIGAEPAEDDTIVDMGEPTPEEAAATTAPEAGASPYVSTEEEALLRAAADRRAGVSPALAADTAGMKEEDRHVVSHSRMFSVSGGDALRMGAIASRADEVYNRLCKLLSFDTPWKHTISIRLLGQHTDPPRANPIRMRVRIIAGQPNFQIRIYPGGGIDPEQLDCAIISMALYERALRELDAEAYPDNIRLPDWLVTGIQQAVLWKNGQIERAIYRNLFERAEMLTPEEIISLEEPHLLDASTRQIYDASCGVLMMSLIDSPGGRIQLKALITEGALDEGTPREMITRYFHELGVDENMLNKWWALELASLALPRASEPLTPLESEELLCEALTLVYYDEERDITESINLDNVYRLRELPDWQRKLRPCIERLLSLSALCFPGYRPIVTEYCRILGDLMIGVDPDKLQERLGPLQELRRAYTSASIRGRDYLDWYEITHTGHSRARSFDTYLAAMELLRRESIGAPTPMSRYLEDIEALYTQKEGEPLPSRLQKQLRAAATPEKTKAARQQDADHAPTEEN